jgi:hypothetical protein
MPNLLFCVVALTSIALFLDLSIVWASPTISRKPLNLKWRGGTAKRTKSLARRVPGPRPDNTVVVDGPDQFWYASQFNKYQLRADDLNGFL